MKRTIRQNDRKGTSTLELLVVLPTLLLIMLGIVELSRAWLMVNLVTTASREGARVGVVTPTSAGDVFDPGPAEARIDAILPGSTRNVTCANPCVPGSQVQADVQVTFDTVVPILLPMLTDLNITRSTTMRYE